MAIIRSLPRKRRLPSFRGRVMVDTFRGSIRVRKWPKKRGKATAPRQVFWINWFRQANLLAKYADAASHNRAIELTKGSGIYPRDLLLAAMRGRLYHWADTNGWKWYSMAAIGDISESLDVLAQTVGDVLVRAADRWRAPPPGLAGDVLTNQGPAAAPAWAAPAGGGGGKVFSQLNGGSNPTGSQATQGWMVELPVSCKITHVCPIYNGAAGLTYVANVVELTGFQIAAILDTSAPYAAFGSSQRHATILMPTQPTLVAGKSYAVLISRTDGGATTNTAVRRSSNFSIPLPADKIAGNLVFATKVPAVGQTFVLNSFQPYSVNIIYEM